ncbi:MAG: DUF6443 domain-containing protein, partial [Cyclobacteriaceae bacterium]
GTGGVPVSLSDTQTGVNYQLKRNGVNVGSAVAGTNNSISFGNQTTAGTYTVVATNATTNCVKTMTGNAVVSVDAAPVGGTLSSNAPTEVFGTAAGTLSLAGYTGNIIKWQSKTTGAWGDITNTTTSHPYSVTTPTTYRVVVKNGVCNEVYSNELFINPLVFPAVSNGGATEIRPGQTTTLTATAGHANYEWFKDNVTVQNGASNTLVVSEPAEYKVTVTSTGNATFTTDFTVITSQLQVNENAVITYDFRTPVDTLASGSLNGRPKIEVFGYDKEQISIAAARYDALGRPTQQVSLESSPDGNDVVVPIEYDNLGRTPKSYLPYVEAAAEPSGMFKADALPAQQAFYAAEATNPYAEQAFEASPLNRVVEAAAPGDNWKLGTGNTVTTSYAINTAGEVIEWTYENLLTQGNQTYAAGELHKTIVTDEDGHVRETYTNKLGQTVLLKSVISVSETAFTYYIHDIKGQLRVVIPPEAVSRLDADFFPVNSDRQAFLDVWAFKYDYDRRSRMTMSKKPGADSVLTVYDQWNRPVLTQDGNHRDNAPDPDEWLFTAYDALNRPVMTGRVKDDRDRATLQTYINGLSATDRFLTFTTNTGAGITHGYQHDAYPLKDIGTGVIDEIFSVTYYDSHDFTTRTYSRPAELNSTAAGLLLPVNESAVKGLATGSLLNDGTGTDTFLESVMFYDEKYRVIQIYTDNMVGGQDIVSNQYDFIGRVRLAKTEHTSSAGAEEILRRFEYDHRDRLEKVFHTINNEAEVQIVENLYNEKGQLEEKNLHDAGIYRQSLDYTYNIRGWLTSINDSQLSMGNDTNQDLFGMELLYDQVDTGLGNTGFSNGNISAMKWSDPDLFGLNVTSRAYVYDYDHLNRMTAANHFENGAVTSNYDVEAIDYDLNGNLDLLTRRNEAGVAMDVLDYDYTVDYITGKGGNRLRLVDDTGDAAGFVDGNTTGDDYNYDANGNLTEDKNKGIELIEYNYLNQPVKTTFNATQGNYIEYQYDAGGNRRSKTEFTNNIPVKTTHYAGEFVYEDLHDTNGLQLQFINHEEGRATPLPGGVGGGFDYQYHLKDHLGNIRMTYSTSTAPPESYTTVQDMESLNDAGNTSVDPDTRFVNIPHRIDSLASTSINEVATLHVGETGVMIMIAVNKGDEVDLSVQANYEKDPVGVSSYNLASILAGTIFGAYNNAVDPSEQLGTAAQNSIGSGVAEMINGANVPNKEQTGTAPLAYINYIYFNKYMIFQRAGFKQITTAAKGVGVHELVTLDAGIMEADGYLFIYLTNESEGIVNEVVPVNFDDLTINQTKNTNIVFASDYYPFGYAHSQSERAGDPAQNYKFNGFEFDTNTGWYDYLARQYDPLLGRFTSTDPAADIMRKWGTYSYAFDNPVRFIDPDGMIPKMQTGSYSSEKGYEPDAEDEKEAEGKNRRQRRLQLQMAENKARLEYYRNGGNGREMPSGAEVAQSIEENVSTGRWQYYDGKNQMNGRTLEVGVKRPNYIFDEFQANGETWYYMSRDDGSPHGMVYDPTGGFIYEVNGVPGQDAWYQQLERLIINSVPSNNTKAKISVAYQYREGSLEWDKLWAREEGNTYLLSPVTVPNPAAATAWFQGQAGNAWNYYLGSNNCAHYSVAGLNAGGAGINFFGPLPSSFPIAPTMKWAAGQPYPVPIGK